MKSSQYVKDITKNDDHKEGQIAKAIEKQTAKVPSDAFLWLSLGSIGISGALQIFGKKQASTFVGQWAPTFLLFGLYNKLVKVAGSDREDRDSRKGAMDSNDSAK